jgi:hypothetical protein
MSNIGINPVEQIGSQGNNVTLRVRGTALKDVPLDIWFEDRTDLKKSTRSSATDGTYSVDLVIPKPTEGPHKQIWVQDMNPLGKKVAIDFTYPPPPVET